MEKVSKEQQHRDVVICRSTHVERMASYANFTPLCWGAAAHCSARTFAVGRLPCLLDRESSGVCREIECCPCLCATEQHNVCQPAGISWNMQLKACLGAKWGTNLHDQVKLIHEDDVKFKLELLIRKQVSECILAAWSSLSATVIKSGFTFVLEQTPDSTATIGSTSKSIHAKSLGVSTTVEGELANLDILDDEVGAVAQVGDVWTSRWLMIPWQICSQMTLNALAYSSAKSNTIPSAK